MTEKERQEALDKLTEGFRERQRAEKAMQLGLGMMTLGFYGLSISLGLVAIRLIFALISFLS